MNQVDSAFQLVRHWLLELLAVLGGIFALVEDFAHEAMLRMGVPGNIQGPIMLVVAVLFIIAVLRLMGGLLRLLLVVLLILFLLHILNLGV